MGSWRDLLGGQEAEVGLRRGAGPRRPVEVVAGGLCDPTEWDALVAGRVQPGAGPWPIRRPAGSRRAVIWSPDLLMPRGRAGTRPGIVTPSPPDGAPAGASCTRSAPAEPAGAQPGRPRCLGEERAGRR